MHKLPSGTRPRAIEPMSIDKPPAGWMFGFEEATANSTDRTVYWQQETYRPNFWQRMNGFHANPSTCIHHRKRFITRWVCSDCGTDL